MHWSVCQGGLGLPVASRVSRRVPTRCFSNNTVLEDVVRQSKILRVQVEITELGRKVTRLAIPLREVERRSHYTKFRRAVKVAWGRSWPEVASLWLGEVANISRLAPIQAAGHSPKPRRRQSGWLWTESDFERRRSNDCCGCRIRIPQFQGSSRRWCILIVLSLCNSNISLM